MHHHDYCPCPPAHDATPQHCHTDDVTPQHHCHTDDAAPHHHCHTDDVAPPMFFDPTTMFSWPPTATTTTSSSRRTYRDNARHGAVRVDVPPPSTTTDDPSCEDTPGGKCAMVILSCLMWGIIIALIIYAVKK